MTAFSSLHRSVLQDPLQAPSYRCASRVHRHEDVKQRSGVCPSVRPFVCPPAEKNPRTGKTGDSELLSWVLRWYCDGETRRRGQRAFQNFVRGPIYRVGQKSKLLILSEYVNKAEKIEGTCTNTNSFRENEALSDVFT